MAAAKPQSPASPTVTVYYLHGTHRCQSCIDMEELSRQTVKTEFAAELAAGGVVWKSLNYDEPENKHFESDFELPFPSLVFVRKADDGTQQWRRVDKTWDFIAEDPDALQAYVKKELRDWIDGKAPAPEGGDGGYLGLIQACR